MPLNIVNVSPLESAINTMNNNMMIAAENGQDPDVVYKQEMALVLQQSAQHTSGTGSGTANGVTVGTGAAQVTTTI